ncbi:hypothetical protein [Kineosporia babensis]|uniref:Uncharacterized protein n=1 Tax=Kineosporia babensis TaxID=499548 RepID=A0A9X1NNV1_9ACTN|nr:hypothetical protein [Kineosporia babensis]MCD5316566.1 hypothetical protein [Kineosporia babensis]
MSEDAEEPAPEHFTSAAADARKARERSHIGVGKWDATVVTYGLAGRLIGTVVVTLPLLWFVYWLVPFGFVGVVCWFVVFPRMLRDLWRRADRL